MQVGRRRWWAVLLVVGLLAARLTAADIIEQVLVKVNGEIITKTDLERRQIDALRELSGVSDPSTLNDAELAKRLASITPQVIVAAVDELLILQRAKELGYQVTDEQFQSVIDSIKKDNKIESEQQFQAALKQEGMTLLQLRKVLERQMLFSRVEQAEINPKIPAVTDAEERQYYEAHPAEFATTPSVTLREILVAVPNDKGQFNVALDEAAKAKAESLRTRALNGESFEKLAAEMSDAPSKANGGLIGPIPRAEMAADLLKTLGSMKAGDITEPLRLPAGYEILKLEQSIESTTLPFEAARGQIADKVFQQKHAVELGKYLTKLRSQALIEWKNDEIRKAFEQGLSAPQAPATAPGN